MTFCRSSAAPNKAMQMIAIPGANAATKQASRRQKPAKARETNAGLDVLRALRV